jgi:hypothetical protein
LAWGVPQNTFYPRRLQTERAPKPAKRGFFLLITTPWLSWHGLGGLAGRSAKKNGVFRKNVGIPHIYRWVW